MMADITAAQQTLYDYWRTLLMEEERNAVRNERLLRKLEDIEQRTNLLYHRTERLSQLRRRFAEMLRQQYLNDPEFKYEHYPYEYKTSQYVEPSYVPDPVLFGLDTPPWMPRDDDNGLLLRRSKDVLERLNAYEPFGRPKTQTRGKVRQDSDEEKKDSEKDSLEAPNGEPTAIESTSDLRDNNEIVTETGNCDSDLTNRISSEEGPGTDDEREEEMNDDLREIDRKVNEIDREIERLEIEVRDREVQRRNDAKLKEKCRIEMEERLLQEEQNLERIRQEREDLQIQAFEQEQRQRDEREALKREVEEIRKEHELREQRALENEQRRKQLEKIAKEREEFQRLEAEEKEEERNRLEQIEEMRRQYEKRNERKAAERQHLEEINRRAREHQEERQKRITKREDAAAAVAASAVDDHHHQQQQQQQSKNRTKEHQGIDKKQNLKYKTKSTNPNDEKQNGTEPHQNGRSTKEKSETTNNDDDENNEAINTAGDVKSGIDDSRMAGELSSHEESVAYVEAENEFYRTTSELEDLRKEKEKMLEEKQNIKANNKERNNSETEMVHREVPKSGQHTPKHNVIKPGPGILKNKSDETAKNSQRRPSFIPRRSSSAMIERERHSPSSVPLIPIDYRSPRSFIQEESGDDNNVKSIQEEVERKKELKRHEEEKEHPQQDSDQVKSSWQMSWEKSNQKTSRPDEREASPKSGEEKTTSKEQRNEDEQLNTGSPKEAQKKEEEEEEDRPTRVDHDPPVNTKVRQSSVFDNEVVPTVLSPRTIRSRRIAEAEKEMRLNVLANELQTELQRDILQRQITTSKMDPTEFIKYYSCYLPSTSNPNVNLKRFQRDIHTPNLEELNIKKTSQVLISGIHGAPESGCSDSSPPQRDTLKGYSPPKEMTSPPEELEMIEENPEKQQDGKRNSYSDDRASSEAGPKAKPRRFSKDTTTQAANKKESETSSRSETPSSSIELNCSKDDGKDARSEYSLLMGRKTEDSPKPTALPLPPPSRRTSMQIPVAGILADGDSRHMPFLPENRTASQLSKAAEGGQSDGSSPVAYTSECISAHHVRELITNNVKHHVPNIVAKKVMGLDLYSGDAPRPKISDPDEDSFFD